MSQEKIPVGKVARAMKLANAGQKIAKNIVTHAIKSSLGMKTSKAELQANNAKDLYGELGSMKGSVLKMAQMLSQDKNILPEAYQDQFKMAQYSAPPLSYPLVHKVFKNEFGKAPLDIFDSFEKKASYAASIGQVHIATKGELRFAVKVQYPGVADSIHSDLKLAKPFASRVMGLNATEIDHYFSEVEHKMIEETQYTLEAQQGKDCAERLSHRKDLHFPIFYDEFSSDRILTMEYLEGTPLDTFAQSHATQKEKNRIGQLLWDAFDEQIRFHRYVHADPHPGNFKVGLDGRLQILDFGCMKDIPSHFYDPFFKLMNPEIHHDSKQLASYLSQLKLLQEEDGPLERRFYTDVYRELITLLGQPFFSETFDFGSSTYFKSITELSDRLQKSEIFRKSKKGRGLKDGLYVNRTYFGLYNLLHMLKAHCKTGQEIRQPAIIHG